MEIETQDLLKKQPPKRRVLLKSIYDLCGNVGGIYLHAFPDKNNLHFRTECKQVFDNQLANNNFDPKSFLKRTEDIDTAHLGAIRACLAYIAKAVHEGSLDEAWRCFAEAKYWLGVVACTAIYQEPGSQEPMSLKDLLSDLGKRAVSGRADQKLKSGWVDHCEKVKQSGAMVAILDDLFGVAGYDPEILQISPRTLRGWAKESGIAFKPGRPKK